MLNSDSSLARNLRREKDALDRRGVTNELRVRHGSVTTEIFEEIRRGQYDLVVAGSSRARGALRQYILGNIGREIVNWAECPVLIVRTGGAGSLMGSLKTLFKSSRKTAPSATE